MKTDQEKKIRSGTIFIHTKVDFASRWESTN